LIKRIKIKAFTLLESLITLMLISIIIALSYALIDLIGRQLSLFEKENTQILEYNLFNSTLINDIHVSYDFDINGTEIMLINYDESIIKYYLSNRKMIRKHDAGIDTFDMRIINVETNRYLGANTLNIQIGLLQDTIVTNYYLNRNKAGQINKQLFNED
jgi:prepilin-type N-terminal cleavage/methylation domain-containing protein